MTEEEKVRKINPYGQVAILNATIIDLEKENAELKKETKRLSAVDKTNELLLKHQNSLKKEVHDLRKENEELKEQMGRAGYRIAELKMQIEKMKNFYNCLHSSRALCPNEHNCEGCKDWRLAE